MHSCHSKQGVNCNPDMKSNLDTKDQFDNSMNLCYYLGVIKIIIWLV